ncbi:MAG TPA: glycosyltransferase family 39 protein [Patescibacteria group bacterium]|uniref:Glycosyltransferase RgtA/B/C/D-like domain-containing protein n=1 Tax=Candidatus Woesebacteria bacterium RBG_13_46_13 TaxID=1802479 RepID=A0A1F7X5K1_9BACT|nr:MAG: hypothetical protein A2Y68_02980 [Candidatus Woesebacteria bacterium RBG_13_46_13]HJX59036.1 glycosyltransferase family 39 protein [Patescibacteria group bacterium]
MAKVKIISAITHLARGIITWVKDHPKEAALLVIILLIGAFLRLYRISEYMIFLGDEGRDAIVVRRLLVNADPILVGPGTSVGNMYLGPIYYYLMAPALWLAGLSPVGPSIMVALLGVATVFFVWAFARQVFGSWAGAVAAALYAVSPTVVTLSGFSWNPNIMPFFAVLTVYSIWQFWKEGKLTWVVVAAAAMGFVLQSHYLGLLLVPTIGVYWLLTLKKLGLGDRSKFLKYSLLGLLVFGVLMSPLFIFDARHGWRNAIAMSEFFRSGGGGLSFGIIASARRFAQVVVEITTNLLAGRAALWGKIILAGILLPLGWIVLKWEKIDRTKKDAFLLFFSWFIFGVVGLSFYSHSVYDHYYGFLFPAPFLIIGGIAQLLGQKRTGKALVILFTALVVTVSIAGSHLWKSPNRQMQRTQEITAKIIQEAKGDSFNFAVIAQRNYEGAYQYLLEKEKAPLLIIDPQRVNETIAKQLFVVCENAPADCDPTHSPKTEIANFGWSKIENTWEVGGVILYKLVHSL